MTCLTGCRVLKSRRDANGLIEWLIGQGKAGYGDFEPWFCRYDTGHWHIQRPKRR
ncbi:hypothetical protein [Actinomadura opuntiae]|uniref:hypothetical protein n=1 Tax=Actinomadura sp. OS1-43 TaxID=604315 RepID=UPI00255AD8BD|nr:hypothetical protein [Actinomadura sp. OS1-43]MDL4815986.1 hypothetical protein [Actinomadura sp. OS1-43]